MDRNLAVRKAVMRLIEKAMLEDSEMVDPQGDNPIRSRRRSLGVSRAQLAHLSGVDQETILLLENNLIWPKELTPELQASLGTALDFVESGSA